MGRHKTPKALSHAACVSTQNPKLVKKGPFRIAMLLVTAEVAPWALNIPCAAPS